MADLRLWMLAFGVLMGIIFPFALIPLGVPAATTLRPLFFAATITAGLLVALVNHWLARRVVGTRLSTLVAGMRHVEDSVRNASLAGDWSSCDPRDCKVPVDSSDEFGAAADSFNRLVDGLSRSNQLASSMTAISQTLASQLELDHLAEAALDELGARTSYEAAAVLVVDGGQIRPVATYGIRDRQALADSEAVARVVRSGHASTMEIPEGVQINAGIADLVPREVRILPVRHGVLTLGVLVAAGVRPGTPEEVAIIDSSLPGLGVALNNALNHERLQRVAALDPLTGAYNRRFGISRIQEEFRRSVRTSEPLGLLMLDIDHFKSVNDTYGHLLGDRVLQAVVAAVRTTLREGDVLVRYGGEEFLVTLPGAGPSDLLGYAEAIRHAVADTAVQHGEQRLQVTVSIGGVTMPNTRLGTPELHGADDLGDRLAAFGPDQDHRVGVLLDHLVPGSKESRIAAEAESTYPDSVLVVGHPFVDIWAAVKPASVGITAWPKIPLGQPWKESVVAELSWPGDTRDAWRRIRGAVHSYRDLEPVLLGAVERLVDFVTEGPPVGG